LSVTIISSLASEDSVISPVPPPIPEPFLAPPPATLERIEEPPPPASPKIDIEAEIEAPASGAMERSAADTTPNDLTQFEQPERSAAEPPPAPAPIPSVKKPAPRLIPPKKKPVVEKEIKEPMPPKEKTYAKQEMMQFEPVTRGRFERSEPTIVEGQDLDIPTFLRKNIRVK